MKKLIKNFSLEELRNYFLEIGEKPYRADQIFNDIFLNKKSSFSELTNIPKALADRLAQDFEIDSIESAKDKKSMDGAVKFLFELKKGGAIETVVMPSTTKEGFTICVSSQSGCAFGCAFCATGTLGFLRHLEPSEIIDQIIFAERFTQTKVSNIVFMGMGEPLHNFENVFKAINIITGKKTKLLSEKRITLSTIGIPEKIIKLSQIEHPPKLAISLHATTDAARAEIIPVAKKYKIKEVMDSAEQYYRTTGMPVTFEYILFSGLNDTELDVRRLSKFTKRFPSKVNLIPFNDVSFVHKDEKSRRLKPCTKAEMEQFSNNLRNAGVVAIVRKTMGSDSYAACGQLAFDGLKQDSLR
ncbi:MAG: Ribosomal large subunit methyltransferase [Ignavibacteria bacterium]|nr:Ribosomal large subunit methyltransferase [Ignavibacteria bacterium]